MKPSRPMPAPPAPLRPFPLPLDEGDRLDVCPDCGGLALHTHDDDGPLVICTDCPVPYTLTVH